MDKNSNLLFVLYKAIFTYIKHFAAPLFSYQERQPHCRMQYATGTATVTLALLCK
jgi:hypothetical protein